MEDFLDVLQRDHCVNENIQIPLTGQHQGLGIIRRSAGGLYLNRYKVGSCYVLHGRYVFAGYWLEKLMESGSVSVIFNFGQQNKIPIVANDFTTNISSENYFQIIFNSLKYGCVLKLNGLETTIPPGLYNQFAEVPCNGVVYIVNHINEISTCSVIPCNWREFTFESILQRANSNPQCNYMKCGDIDVDLKCIHQFTKERFTRPNDTDIITYMISHSTSNMCLPVANEKGQVIAMHVSECPYTIPGAEENFIGKAVILADFVEGLKSIGIDIFVTDNRR